MSSQEKSRKSEELDWLNKKKSYLETWKANLKGANDALPYAEANLVNTDWAIEAINSQPAVSGIHPSLDFGEQLKRDYLYTVSALPPIPAYDLDQLATASSITVSGTASIYNYVQSFSKYDTPEARNYVRTCVDKYDDLQVIQLRPQFTRSLVTKLNNTNTLERFDRAQKAYLQAKSGINAPTQAANEIRNLLYGIKGNLLELARKIPKENITWQEMARRISKPGPKDVPYQELAAQETVYTSLVNDLSPTAKDWKQVSLTELNQTWTQVIDFIYTVLGLVNFP